jgi:hypothetical protein
LSHVCNLLPRFAQVKRARSPDNPRRLTK